jgi:glycosyltransferase involved in cell wall biosynthesis
MVAKRVSIGLPVFNEHARIAGCIENLLAQTYQDLEICVSDNHSLDGTDEILTTLAAKHKALRIVRQRKNIGLTANFEVVRRMSTGEYFMWIGADDRVEPTYVAKMVRELEAHPRATLSHSATILVNESGCPVREIRYLRLNPNSISPLRQAMLLLTHFKSARRRKYGLFVHGLYRKSVLDQIMELALDLFETGDRGLPALAALSGGMRYVDEPLFRKHVHRKHFRTRHPTDPLSLAMKRHTTIWTLIRSVMTCPTIPWWRRLHGVVIAAPFLANRPLAVLRRAGLPVPAVRSKIEF